MVTLALYIVSAIVIWYAVVALIAIVGSMTERDK